MKRNVAHRKKWFDYVETACRYVDDDLYRLHQIMQSEYCVHECLSKIYINAKRINTCISNNYYQNDVIN